MNQKCWKWRNSETFQVTKTPKCSQNSSRFIQNNKKSKMSKNKQTKPVGTEHVGERSSVEHSVFFDNNRGGTFSRC